MSGNWKITGGKKSTALVMQVLGVLTVPLPGLMKRGDGCGPGGEVCL